MCLVAQVKHTLEMDTASVAITNLFFSELVEEELLTFGFNAPENSAPKAKVARWSELVDWQTAKTSMQALGLEMEAEDPFTRIGLSPAFQNLSPDMLERRRRLLEIVDGAMKAHKWNEEDCRSACTFMKTIDQAVDSCHTLLPELIKKSTKKKKASGQSSGIAVWQEPSSLVFEFALKRQGNATCALHLSNLQRFPLTSLCNTLNPGTGMPKVLPIDGARELYTKLSQAQVRVEEALGQYKDGHLTIWAPDNHDQIPRIIGGVNKLYTERGYQIQLTMLVPFVPLPGCHSAEHILDVWSHPLLHHKYSSVVKEVCFIREPSRCVFTRDNNPYHAVKNLVAITVAANPSNTQLGTLSMRSMLLDVPGGGDEILVDVQTKYAAEVLLSLNRAGAVVPGAPTHWRMQERSRGNTRTQPRTSIVGEIVRVTTLEAKAIINSIKAYFGDQRIIIGRSSMFADRSTIVAEGSIEQFTSLGPVISECVIVSPHKALMTPSASADVCSRWLTDDDMMRSLCLRYRKSSPLKGGFFARPKDLACHLHAERHNAYAARQGGELAALLALQVHIEVLGLDAGLYEDVAARVITKIAEETSTVLQESHDQDEPLKGGEWRKVLRNGGWTGKIILQCKCVDDMTSLYGIAHGRGVCVGGMQHAIHITSLSNAFLGSQALERQLARPPMSE